ncbi:MAG: pantoate--beta-alanine ligase [Minicystis sp.]
MLRIREPEAFHAACDDARASSRRVALVPTMGALHEGHATLVREARRHADFVAVSVFINPTQFGPSEDLARYPRTLDADLARCEAAGAALVFAPNAEAMYPPGDETRVRVGPTAAPLCGPHRPGHFEGVATVVAKLFALTGRCQAFFGRKDYQQLKVIERFTRDLFLPVTVTGVRTVREPDGLAMSSRNAYLSAEQRAAALAIPRGISLASQAFARGERSAAVLRALCRAEVERVSSSIDYVDLADPETLRVHEDGARVGERALIALAIRLGGARLIDNMVLGEEPPPLAGDAQAT